MAEKPRSERLEIRLDKDEKDAFQAAADIAGTSLATWVRERLRRAARVELEEADRQIPFLGRK